MTPVEQVAALYTPDCPRTFVEDLEHYLMHGYVFNTPTMFCMCKPICNTWYIYAFAGDMAEIFRLSPYTLKFVQFERRGKPAKLYLYETIQRKIQKTS